MARSRKGGELVNKKWPGNWEAVAQELGGKIVNKK